ncbi:hypothetical protein FOA52_009954 [Chlamydomonas sp. UWO 241]|nr:hypothetical protein FOA52_009954 [Chlamydomonas sp. UWO 241]
MSRRRKHVTLGLLDEVHLGEGQSVARVEAARGGNLIEVELRNGRNTLVLMPAKFIKKLWVRKGGFVVIEQQAEAEEAGHKVTGTIATILYEEHIKELKKQGVWPIEFDEDTGRSCGANASPSTLDGGSGSEPDGDGSGSGGDGAGVDAATEQLATASLGSGSGGNSSAASGRGAGRGGAEGVPEEAAAGAAGATGAAAAGAAPGEAGAVAAATAAPQQDAGCEQEEEGGYESDGDDGLPPLVQNPNRRVYYHEPEDSGSESD